MERPSKETTLMGMAGLIAKRSTCNRRQVGAIIALYGRVVSSGYNGAPKGLPHCDVDGCGEGTAACVNTIHAEANAIAWAARSGSQVEGSIMYVTTSPCWDCAKLIIASGIVEVIYLTEYRDRMPLELLKRAGVHATQLEV